MLRDFNIFATTKTNHKVILEQLKQLALTNNTSGASIYDLGNIVKATSIAEVSDILKDAEGKQMAMRQQEMQQQQQMQQQQLQAKAQEDQMKLQFEAEENARDRQKDITVAEIRASGYGAMQDIDQNKVSDFQDSLKDIRETQQYREQMNFKRQQASVNTSFENQKMDLQRQKLASQRDIANKQLEIAKVNKNKYDKPESKDEK
jgi:hypothetical protein